MTLDLLSRAVILDATESDFFCAAPKWARDTLFRALDGLEFSEEKIQNALRAVNRTNRNFSRDLEAAKNAESKNSGKNYSQKKAAKRARDREIRMKMKGAKRG